MRMLSKIEIKNGFNGTLFAIHAVGRDGVINTAMCNVCRGCIGLLKLAQPKLFGPTVAQRSGDSQKPFPTDYTVHCTPMSEHFSRFICMRVCVQTRLIHTMTKANAPLIWRYVRWNDSATRVVPAQMAVRLLLHSLAFGHLAIYWKFIFNRISAAGCCGYVKMHRSQSDCFTGQRACCTVA